MTATVGPSLVLVGVAVCALGRPPAARAVPEMLRTIGYMLQPRAVPEYAA